MTDLTDTGSISTLHDKAAIRVKKFDRFGGYGVTNKITIDKTKGVTGGGVFQVGLRIGVVRVDRIRVDLAFDNNLGSSCQDDGKGVG